ncbi:hypothetical protein N2152v2_008696 [Parachlorella kessleri]
MGAYTAGLAAAQGAGMALRVSCATPVLGPVGGVLGVGFASALAGQAGIKWRQFTVEGRNPLQEPLRGVRLQDMLVDAALGIALYKVMGGRFRSVMPSDLTKVGAIARESLPAAGVEYASEANRRELLRMYRTAAITVARDGAYVAAGRTSLVRLPVVKQAAEALGIPTGPPRQRYFPQCISCSQKQSAAIRNDRVALVFHEVLHHGGKASAWHYAGTLVGLRWYSAGSGGSSGGQGESWQAGQRGVRRRYP